MKKIITVVILLFILVCIPKPLMAQFRWQWAQRADGASQDFSSGVATDAAGNAYVTGWYDSPTMTFGTTTITNVGQHDVFVAKYDAAGNCIWAASAGGNAHDISNNVAVDGNGNVYIGGWFESATMVFGTTTLTNTGGVDIFVAKYNSNGNLLWVKSTSSYGLEFLNALCADAAGNVYITGYFEVGYQFGPSYIGNSGGSDVFVAKYDTNGNVLWARAGNGNGGEQGFSIATNGNKVYVTGNFSGSGLSFESGIPILTSAGVTDMFLVCFDIAGTALWAKRAGGTISDYGGAVTATGNDLYVAGGYTSPFITIGTNTFTNQGDVDLFIAKYDQNGNMLWAKNYGSTGSESPASISADGHGNIYLTGNFSNSLIFGNTTLTSTNTSAFLTKYDSTGNVLWATKPIDPGNGTSRAVSTNNTGDVYLAGHFYGSATFGNTTLPATPSQDIFVAKINNPVGLTAYAAPGTIYSYPNPFSSTATLQFKKQLYDTTVLLYNSTGQVVRAINNINGDSYTIDRGDLPAGIYYCAISEAGGILQTGKLVITD